FDTYNQLVGLDDINGDGLGDLMGRKENGDTYIYRALSNGHLRMRIPGTFGWQKAAMLVGAGGNPGAAKRSILGVNATGGGFWYDSKNNGELFSRVGRFPQPEGWLAVS